MHAHTHTHTHTQSPSPPAVPKLAAFSVNGFRNSLGLKKGVDMDTVTDRWVSNVASLPSFCSRHTNIWSRGVFYVELIPS